MRTTRLSTWLRPDKVVVVLNAVLQKLYDWCCRNRLIPHPSKTEYMTFMLGHFVGPSQAVSLGNSVVIQVKSTKCLGVEFDSDLNWKVYVKELSKSFHTTTARADFYFKEIFPSVAYGLVVWGSCGKSLFDR